MGSVETLTDIAEEMADKFGIYGCHQPDKNAGPEDGHPENCQCRICYVIGLTTRMAAAAEVDRKLSAI